MNLIYKYRIIIAIVLPVMVLIALKTCSTGNFKNDAKKWSEPSFNHSNIICDTEIKKLSGGKLIINLDKECNTMHDRTIEAVSIPPDSILSKKNLNTIRNHKGPVLLSSSDPALSARIWMVISQTGCRNIYILTIRNDNETFKNKFPPDTLARPEL
jgi:hypothetical protein